MPWRWPPPEVCAVLPAWLCVRAQQLPACSALLPPSRPPVSTPTCLPAGEHGPTERALAAYQAVRQPQAEFVQKASLEMYRDYLAGGAPPEVRRRRAQ